MHVTFRALHPATSTGAPINWRRVAAIAVGFSILYIGHCDGPTQCRPQNVASCE